MNDSKNYTFSMLKPKAVAGGKAGNILQMIETVGFKIRAMKMTQMSIDQARAFYEIHASKPFYQDLVEFMASGPIIALVLEKENAVEEFRSFIGNTNPEKANIGSVRNLYGSSIQENAVHGSDSPENAKIESAFFFSPEEIYEY